VTESVNAQKVNTTTSLSSSVNPSAVGQAVTFNASVTSTAGTPSGFVQFKDNGANIGSAQPLSGGGLASITATPTSGVHTIDADYLGDTNFLASSVRLVGSQIVGPVVQFDLPDYAVNEADGSVTVKVNRTSDTAGIVTVS